MNRPELSEPDEVLAKELMGKTRTEIVIWLHEYRSYLASLFPTVSREEAKEIATSICGTANIYSNDRTVLPIIRDVRKAD